MTEFQHSVKVPRLYKDASRILKSVHEGGSLKDLVYNHNKFSNIKALHALVGESLKYDTLLSRILHSLNILKLEKFDEWLAKILLTELIFGKKQLPGNSKPVLTLLKYQEDIEKQLNAADIYNVSSYSREKRKAVKPRYVRVNTLKISLEDAINKFKDEGWEELECPSSYEEYLQLIQDRMFSEEYIFVLDYHIKNLLVFPSTAQFYDHPAYLEKYIILQDKASCLLTCCVSIRPGSIILDMCAAPGMKTSLLAACINNEGKIYAIEQDIRRYNVMNNLLSNFGITCVVSGNSDAGSIGPDTCKNVKYIIVDPSCSGSGMTSRVEDVEGNESNQYYTKLRLQKLANIQGYLLRHAVSNFPTAKYVFYSTCSLQEEENEMVVESVLGCAKHHGFSLMNLKKKIDGWKNFGSDKYECGKKCVYSKPNCDFTNGGFLAVFKRKSQNCTISDNRIKEEFMEYENTSEKNSKPLSEQFFALVNTLKISVEDAIQFFVDSGWKHLPTPVNYNIFLSGLQEDKKRIEERFFEQDFHVKELLVFPMGIVDELSERFIKERKFILLDKVSCLAVSLLDTVPGCKVLDMCAGVEKMSLFLASKMNNNGSVYAYEPNPHFHRELLHELAKSGISCVRVKLDSGLYSNSNDCPGVKLILVSPPCSGSGSGLAEKTQHSLIKNSSNTRKEYILRHYIVTQFSLLRHAFTEFPEAHRIVYVTRSVHPEENEDIINALLVLAKFHGFELIDAPSRIDGWKNECLTKYYWGKKCLITRDETSITKGFFIAVFERNIKSFKFSNDSSENHSSVFNCEKKVGSDVILSNNTSSTEQKYETGFDSFVHDKESINVTVDDTEGKKNYESTNKTLDHFVSNSFQEFEGQYVDSKKSIQVLSEISDPQKQSDLNIRNKKHKKRKRKTVNEDTYIDVIDPISDGDAFISTTQCHTDQKEDSASKVHLNQDSESCGEKIKKRKKVNKDQSDNILVKKKAKQKKHSKVSDKNVIVPVNENGSFQFDDAVAEDFNVDENVSHVFTEETAETVLLKSKTIKDKKSVESLVKEHKKKKKDFCDLDLDEIFSVKRSKVKKRRKDNDELINNYNENLENLSNEDVAAEGSRDKEINIEKTEQSFILDNKKKKKKKKKEKKERS